MNQLTTINQLKLQKMFRESLKRRIRFSRGDKRFTAGLLEYVCKQIQEYAGSIDPLIDDLESSGCIVCKWALKRYEYPYIYPVYEYNYNFDPTKLKTDVDYACSSTCQEESWDINGIYPNINEVSYKKPLFNVTKAYYIKPLFKVINP